MTKPISNEKRRDFLKISGATAAMVAGQGYLFAKTDVVKIFNLNLRRVRRYLIDMNGINAWPDLRTGFITGP